MSFIFDVPPIPLARPMIPYGVFRYNSESMEMTPLSRVRILEISFREGARPSNALFEYVSQDFRNPAERISFENAMPIARMEDSQIVAADDEIVVAAQIDDGNPWYLFHGYAQIPECQFTGNHQVVRFAAQGVESRCWDGPIEFCVMRQSDDPTTGDSNVSTGNEVRFNPKVRGLTVGNQVSDGFESEDSNGRKFAVFCDKMAPDRKIDAEHSDNELLGQKWNLFTAVNHILTTMNGEEKHVKNPSYDELKELLFMKVPLRGRQFFDPTDDGTYREKPIDLTDIDVTGKPWPEAVDMLLSANGYRMNFVLEDGDDGAPATKLEIYRLNDTSDERSKSLYLQEWQATLDPAASNVSAARMQLDTSGIINQISVHTSQVRVEAGFILAPLFKIIAADHTNANDFGAKAEGFNTVRDKYRLWGFDESGEGHQTFSLSLSHDDENDVLFGDATWATDAGDLTELFPPDDDGDPTYVVRRRPPLPTLWAKGADGDYIRAELYISMDYQGDAPELRDPASGYNWYKVSGGWELCRDRLGVRLTHEKINEWHIGKMPPGAPTRLAGGVVRVLDWLTNPSLTEGYAFTLMLVCVVESDNRLDILSARRDASPTKFEITRVVDLRSKFRPGLVHKSSPFYPNAADLENDPSGPFRSGEAEDQPDTQEDMKIQGNEDFEALAYAQAKREAHQLGRWAGQVTIPRLSPDYLIGDRIEGIEGRETLMQINVDGNGQEAPAYPRVIGLTFDFHSGQSTHLILDDNRSDRGGRHHDRRI